MTFFLRPFVYANSLSAVFLLVSLPLLLMLAFVVPFGEVADEPAQSLRAEALLSGQFAGHRMIAQTSDREFHITAGVNADPALLFAALTPVTGSTTVSATELSQKRSQGWTGQKIYLEMSPLAVYPAIFYVPGAVGIGMAHWFGEAPYKAAIFGRLANVFAYLIIGGLALVMARQARALMFGVLATPMALNLGASLSQDGLVIAVNVLSAALLSRAWADSRDGRPLSRHPAYWGSAFALLCVALVKPPYLPLALILLLPAAHHNTRRKDLYFRLLTVGVVTLVVCAWFGWVMIDISAPNYFPPRPVGPLLSGNYPAVLDHTDPISQLHVLLAAPYRFITLPLHTFWQNPLWQEMIGVLGWIDVMLPGWLYKLWFFAALVAVLAGFTAKTKNSVQHLKGHLAAEMGGGLVIGVAVFASFLAIYLSQYLVWTTVGAAFIEGPQGRYLLPLVPFIGLAIPRWQSAPGWLSPVFTATAVIPALLGLAVLPFVIVKAYYLR